MIQIVVLWGGVWCLAMTNYAQDTSSYQKSVSQLLEIRDQAIGNDSLQGSDALFTILANEIFPAWYGTPWDFNGISNVPGKGEIACGYFVSTTLKHAGFNLNRYKLAQQASAIITTRVCGATYTQKITGYEDLCVFFESPDHAMFIVGLDYHVGFIVVAKGTAFFVHSDYLTGKVIREPLSTSKSLQSSQHFVLGQLTHNAELMHKWHQQLKIY